LQQPLKIFIGDLVGLLHLRIECFGVMIAEAFESTCVDQAAKFVIRYFIAYRLHLVRFFHR
jgi:hypothetical protein